LAPKTGHEKKVIENDTNNRERKKDNRMVTVYPLLRLTKSTALALSVGMDLVMKAELVLISPANFPFEAGVENDELMLASITVRLGTSRCYLLSLYGRFLVVEKRQAGDVGILCRPASICLSSFLHKPLTIHKVSLVGCSSHQTTTERNEQADMIWRRWERPGNVCS
jgi:hypothetical protein